MLIAAVDFKWIDTITAEAPGLWKGERDELRLKLRMGHPLGKLNILVVNNVEDHECLHV